MPSDLTEAFAWHGGGGFSGSSLRVVCDDIVERALESQAIAGHGRTSANREGDDCREEVNETTRLYRLQHSVNGLVNLATALKAIVDGMTTAETLTRGRPCRTE